MASRRSSALYPNAQAIPLFFETNLLSKNRVIKYFDGNDAVIKSFYFQLMKLACEIEVEGKDYLQKIKKIFISKQYFGEGELADKMYTDKQYREYMNKFLQIIEEQEKPSFERTAKEYPIIDSILLLLFKKIVPISLLSESEETQCYQNAKQIFLYLGKVFQITIREIDHCFHFQESDIFVYLQKAGQVYIAFDDSIVEKYNTYSNQQHSISSIQQTYLPNDISKDRVVTSQREMSVKSQREMPVTSLREMPNKQNTLYKISQISSNLSHQNSQTKTIKALSNRSEDIELKQNISISAFQSNQSSKKIKNNVCNSDKLQHINTRKQSQNSSNNIAKNYLLEDQECNKYNESNLFSSNQIQLKYISSAKQSQFQRNNEINHTYLSNDKFQKQKPCVNKEYKTFSINSMNKNGTYFSNFSSINELFKQSNKYPLPKATLIDQLHQESFYDRFTNNSILEELDQKYRNKIVDVKKQYKQEKRKNVQPFMI